MAPLTSNQLALLATLPSIPTPLPSLIALSLPTLIFLAGPLPLPPGPHVPKILVSLKGATAFPTSFYILALQTVELLVPGKGDSCIDLQEPIIRMLSIQIYYKLGSAKSSLFSKNVDIYKTTVIQNAIR